LGNKHGLSNYAEETISRSDVRPKVVLKG